MENNRATESVAPFLFSFSFSQKRERDGRRTPFLGAVPSEMVQITLERLSQTAWKIKCLKHPLISKSLKKENSTDCQNIPYDCHSYHASPSRVNWECQDICWDHVLLAILLPSAHRPILITEAEIYRVLELKEVLEISLLMQ